MTPILTRAVYGPARAVTHQQLRAALVRDARRRLEPGPTDAQTDELEALFTKRTWFMRYLGDHACRRGDADGTVECWASWEGAAGETDAWRAAFYFAPHDWFPRDFGDDDVPFTLSYITFCPSCGREIAKDLRDYNSVDDDPTTKEVVKLSARRAPRRRRK